MPAMHRTLGILLAGLVFAASACVTQEIKQTEPLLSAAGFKNKIAETPAQLANIETMVPHKLVPHQRDGETYWVYADPKVCKCVYVGNEKAYQEYQRLAFKQRLANQQEMTAAMNQDAAMNWGLWGGWGPWY